MKDPYLLHIFNPTKNVSPFDVNMAYEAEFDGVIPYSNVTLEEGVNSRGTIWKRNTEKAARPITTPPKITGCGRHAANVRL